MGFKPWEEVKDPDGTLDYAADWSGWLGTDTIVSAQWTVPSDITITQQSTTTTVSTVWVSGGISGNSYDCTCRITTSTGRTCDRTFRLKVKER